MLSRAEISKDAAQEGIERAADRVKRVMNVVVDAVTEVVGEVGGLANDLFEIGETTRAALADRRRQMDGREFSGGTVHQLRPYADGEPAALDRD